MARTFKSTAELFAEAGGYIAARPSRGDNETLSVDEVNQRIADVIKSEPLFSSIAVRGELRNLKRHSSGHVYFALLGESSRIPAAMWSSSASHVVTWPRDGDEIIVIGSVGVYVKGGYYQLNVTRIIPIGLGAQARAKEELRARLDAEGVFDLRHKRLVPRYPSKVAVITSQTGAAIQDIIRVSGLRAPYVDIIVVDALVQGIDAPDRIARAFTKISTRNDIDCVILARGGGSQEDLSPFDDERVVRAIRSCPVPVVTGIGHDIDSSLSDLAADVERPTPSAAAEFVFPDSAEIIGLLDSSLAMISSELLHMSERADDELSFSYEKLSSYMTDMIERSIETLDAFEASLRRYIDDILSRADETLASLTARLDSLSPLSVLSRGYAICKDKDGEIIASVGGLSAGDEIVVCFSDGEADVCVRETRDLR